MYRLTLLILTLFFVAESHAQSLGIYYNRITAKSTFEHITSKPQKAQSFTLSFEKTHKHFVGAIQYSFLNAHLEDDLGWYPELSNDFEQIIRTQSIAHLATIGFGLKYTTFRSGTSIGVLSNFGVLYYDMRFNNYFLYDAKEGPFIESSDFYQRVPHYARAFKVDLFLSQSISKKLEVFVAANVLYALNKEKNSLESNETHIAKFPLTNGIRSTVKRQRKASSSFENLYCEFYQFGIKWNFGKESSK